MIVGSAGDDVLLGTSASECILGLGGDDMIEGGAGDDWIYGGAGNDVIRGNQGADRIFGGGGDDEILGGEQEDVIDGDDGDDFIDGEEGRDVIRGGEGADLLRGGNGKDVLEGGAGCDQLDGRNGADRLFGGAGDDAIHGGHAAERAEGGDGNDVITIDGPPPTSTVFGGPGEDRCDGEECERPAPSVCTADAECAPEERCLDHVEMCASTSFCGCTPSDTSCDAIDDDCDGAFDEDYQLRATQCGVGACAATGETSCVGGSVVDSCVPGTGAPEDATCDAVDDDCDGLADEDYAELPTSCGVGACAATGETSCVEGTVVDSCAPTEPQPSDDTCDAIDEDCDAATDEEYASVATTCGVGACAASGATSCVGGTIVDSCAPGSPAADDASCDAVDDDCDGATDEDYASVTTTCGVGACSATGSTSCVAGAVIDSCVAGTPAPNDASCDAVDDDCDGTHDEDFASTPTTCGVGACTASGATSCVGGTIADSCAPGDPAAHDATCDGIDDDCDARTDEDYVSLATACGVGACAANGSTSCVAGSIVDSCDPGEPATNDATCDAIDDDCDGTNDEDYVRMATTCGVGACASAGLTSCVDGTIVDSCDLGEPAANDPTCNAVDDDCDGTNDEDYASMPTSCGTGACASSGSTSCVAGTVVDSCDPGDPAASDASCDAIDDDCDGTNDEDFVVTATSCGVGGCAREGTRSCVDGSAVDSCVPGAPEPSDARCDAIDEDCDGPVDEEFTPFCAGDVAVTCAGGLEQSTSCSDANVCNGIESCGSGVCFPGTPPELDDGNPCTVDACDPSTGVSHDPAAAGTACPNGDLCDGDETCDGAGACTSGVPPELDDGNPCTSDTCDPLGGVSHPPASEGTSCEDADPCNGVETCDGAGHCRPGTRPVEGPCVPPPPFARIFVDEERNAMESLLGASVVAFDGTSTPSLDASGLTYNPNGVTDGAADVTVRLVGSDVSVPARIRLAAPPSTGARHIEVWTSATDTASTSFTRVFAGEITADDRDHDYLLEASGARYVRIRVLDNWSGQSGRGQIKRVSVWTRPRDGGAVSLAEAGVTATATSGSFPQRAIDYSTTTFWTASPVAQTLTIDLPGTAWHHVDRVRMHSGSQLRNFEIWTSETTNTPSAFTRVLSAVKPNVQTATARDFDFFFTSTRARYVQLRTIDTYGPTTVSVSRIIVLTPNEGGLTVPFDDRSVAGGTPIVRRRWDFGDGTRSDEQHPVHTFPGPGTYEVQLEVVDEYGLVSTCSFVYTAHAPPVGDFVHTPVPPRQANTLRVDDRSTGDAPLVEVAWTPRGAPIATQLNDVRNSRPPGGNATWTLERGGELSFRFEAIDAHLLRDVVARTIVVENVRPTIDVGSDQTVVWGQPWSPIATPIVTDATSAEWFALRCTYDFGDGGTGEVLGTGLGCTRDNVYVAHTWDEPGTYTIVASAIDPFGEAGTDTFVVEVTRREAGLVLGTVEPGAGSRTVVAQLSDRYDPTRAIAGRTVRLALGSQSATAITDVNGRAQGSLTFAGDVRERVVATFDGDAFYFHARGEQSYPEQLRPRYPGNCGTDYLLAIPNPCMDDGRCPLGERGAYPLYRHHLFFSAEAHTSVEVDYEGLGITAHVAVDESGVAILELPPSIAVQLSATVRRDVIRVRSERLVCVHGLGFFPHGSDGYLALPTSTLGREYVIGSFGGRVQEGFGQTYVSQFTLAAVENDTSITIVPAYAVRGGPGTPNTFRQNAGVPFTITLDAGEVMQLRADDRLIPPAGATLYDLTGTTIVASADVSVSAGHMTAFVPPAIQAANYLVEQLPPVDTLGTDYVISPFARRGSGSIVRVIAAHAGTEVRLDGTLVATVNRGAFHEINLTDSSPHHVSTSQPALVMQYAKGVAAESSPTGATGDPTMIVVVPTTQFDNGIRVATVPDTVRFTYEHYLSLVVPSADVGGVRVDGAPVAAPFTPVPGTSWAVANVQVADGVHDVSHVRPTVPIGVTVYGWGDDDAYGFPARLRLIPLAAGCTPSATIAGDGMDNECDGRVDEELANGVDDDGDGLTDEDLFFESGEPVNLTPIAYERADALREDTTKGLVLSAFDGNGDALTYEVLSGPSNGVLTGSAETRLYDPFDHFNGVDTFTYRACDALSCSEPATFTLLVYPEDDRPIVTMDALYDAFEDELFELALVATDVEGSPLTWSVVSGPAGLGVDGDLVFWTPDDRHSNLIFPVTVRASDGASSTDVTFGIRVLPRPDEPYIISAPVTSARFNLGYLYDVQAVDPDPGDPLEYLLVEYPPTMTIHASTGVITWSPVLADAGSHPVEVIVRDGAGLLSQPQRFSIEVSGDDAAPNVTVTVEPITILPGESTTLQVTATDEDDAFIEGASVGGTPVALDASGRGTWTSSVPGRFIATASAVDPSGNRGAGETSILVLDPSDTTRPVVELDTPASNAELTYLHEATGTVRDDHLARWWLEARRADRDTYQVLLTGTNEIDAARVGTIDTTQLENGIFFLRLRAEDANGQSAEDIHPVRIEGGAKLGVVRMSFVDLVVPDFGIPIAVVRSYDSRVKEPLDFGVGWSLDIRAGSIMHNYRVGEGIAVFTREGDFIPCQNVEDQLGHYAEVRLSDEEWYVFRPVMTELGVLSGGCQALVGYEQVDGVRPGAQLLISAPSEDHLRVRATAIEVVRDGRFAQESNLTQVTTGELFDPQEFELRLPDGRKFFLDNDRGVTGVEDRNGNQLVVTDDGLIHSSGRYVQFIRDAEGRIDAIVDESGRTTGYDYDARGNLVAFEDVADRTTRYEYAVPAHPHHLTSIVDWRGVRMAALDYGDDGRLRELCDADGVCIDSEYDLAARTMTRFDGLARPTRYTYDERGNVTAIVDGLDHVTTMRYGPLNDRMTSRTDPTGAMTRFGYDAYDNLATQIEPYVDGEEDPETFTTRWTRNPAGDPLTHTLPTGGTIHYEYDANGNERFVRDDSGNVIFERTYYPDGSLETFTDRFGTVRYQYENGLPTRVTSPDGTVTELAYDIAGNLRQLRRGGVTQRFYYDALGRRTFADYGNGATVSYEYDSSNDWSAIEGPTFGRVERQISAAGNLLRWTLPNGDTFSRTYDVAGTLRSETNELGNVTRYEYDAAGQIGRVIDEARGATTRYVRDDAGRVIETVNPLSESTFTEYDIRGAVRRRTDARGFSTSYAQTPLSSTTVDALGHTTIAQRSTYGLPSSTLYEGGSTRSTTFDGQTHLDDSASYPRSEIDEASRDRDFTYDGLGVLRSVTDLGENAWTYDHRVVLGGDVQFDVHSGDVWLGLDEGRAPVSRYQARDESRDAPRPRELDVFTDALERVTSPEGEVTSWTFGAGGLATRVDYPFGGALTRTIGSDLRVSAETRPFGTTLTYTRDAAGRVVRREGSDGSVHRFEYTEGDRIDLIEDGTGITDYRYDPAGRFEGLDYPGGATFRQGRDALDRVNRVTVASGGSTFETRYTYDRAGNLETLTDPFGRVTTYEYDDANRLVLTTRPNGVTTRTTYDARNRIESMVHRDALGAVIASVAYVRAPSGEPTRITREDGSYVLIGYDDALRVTSEHYHFADGALDEAILYTYDRDGNRTSRTTNAGVETYVYESGSRLVRIERAGLVIARYDYDTGGRVTRIERDGRVQNLTYDADDHLTVLADETAGTEARLAFDAEGRRVRREDRAGGIATDTIRFGTAPTLIGSIESPHVTTDESGTAVGAYVFDGEHPVARYDASGAPVYYLRDAMGSVIGLADTTSSTARIYYDGFGNLRRREGLLASLPMGRGGDFRFHGVWMEPDEHLYYVRARNYEPLTGRFLTRERLTHRRDRPEARHPYALASNRATQFRDPSGLVWDDTIGGLSAAQAATLILATVAVTYYLAQRSAVGGLPSIDLPELPRVRPADIALAVSLTQIRNQVRDEALTTDFDSIRRPGCQKVASVGYRVGPGGVITVVDAVGIRSSGAPGTHETAAYFCSLDTAGGFINESIVITTGTGPYMAFYDSRMAIPPRVVLVVRLP